MHNQTQEAEQNGHSLPGKKRGKPVSGSINAAERFVDLRFYRLNRDPPYCPWMWYVWYVWSLQTVQTMQTSLKLGRFPLHGSRQVQMSCMHTSNQDFNL